MKILRITMDGEEKPHFTITKAFERFDTETIWWQHHEVRALNGLIRHKLIENQYDAVFMQIQGDGIIEEDTARLISQRSLGFNWTGDVRKNIDWYVRLGQHLVTLFTNYHDVKTMRSKGLRADYLQTGYDTEYYKLPDTNDRYNKIAFCANYYPEMQFPLTNYRVAMCFELKKAFGDDFNLYGRRWRDINLCPEADFVDNSEEAQIYQKSLIAINCSHFNYSQYFSDRMLREMACGALVLSHNFTDHDKEFQDGKHFVIWKDYKDLIEKCRYYLNNPEEAKRIGLNAANHVKNNFTWEHRMDELISLIKKYK